MKNEIRFTVKESKPLVEQSIRRYLLSNAYYELNAKSGLKFKRDKSSFTKQSFHPLRLESTIDLQIVALGNSSEVVAKIKFLKAPWTWLTIGAGFFQATLMDQAYFEEFLHHFKDSIQGKTSPKFLPQIQERALKDFSKTYNIVAFLGYCIAIIISFSVKSISISILMFFVGIIIHFFGVKISNGFLIEKIKSGRYPIGISRHSIRKLN